LRHLLRADRPVLPRGLAEPRVCPLVHHAAQLAALGLGDEHARGVRADVYGCAPHQGLSCQSEQTSATFSGATQGQEEAAVAKTNRDEGLFRMMRAAGVRRKVAADVSDAVGRGLAAGEKAPKVVRQAVRDFSALAARLEDRVSAGPPKRAAPKRAQARKRPAEPQAKTAEPQAKTAEPQ